MTLLSNAIGSYRSVKAFAFACVAVAAISAPQTADAKLLFSQTTVELKAHEGEEKLVATYPYKNDGADPVKILSVETSCGCLVASSSQVQVRPGESAVVSSLYTIGVNERQIKQTITIVTDERTNNVYVLTFKADLPPALKNAPPPTEPVTPQVLYWTRPPFETKTVTIALKAAHASRFEVTCDAPESFRVETETTSAGEMGKLKVSPLDGAKSLRGALTITLETDDGRKTPYFVSLRILSAKPAP